MRGYVLSIWSLFDPIYYFFSRLTYLPCAEKEGNIFRIRLTKYKGRRIILSDGTAIDKNDKLIKIHLHNVKILKELKDIKSDLKRAKIIYRSVQRSLPAVEQYIRNYRYSQEIKGIIGITHLNKGCERLGFEIHEMAHPIYKRFKWLAFLPIEILARKGSSSIKDILTYHPPKYLFMSANILTKMYRK